MRCPSCQRDSIEIIADYWAHFVTTHHFAKWEKKTPHQQQPFAAEAPAQHGHLERDVGHQVATRRVLMGCFLGYKVGTKNPLPSRARSRIPPMEEENKIIGTQLPFMGGYVIVPWRV